MRDMNDILLKINEVTETYYDKYGRYPNAILINEDDLTFLKNCLSLYLVDDETLKEKPFFEIRGLKVIRIKYGEIQAVEVLENE